MGALAIIISIIFRPGSATPPRATPAPTQNLAMPTSTTSASTFVTTTPSVSSKVLFADDFDQGLDPAWESGFGEWRMVNERLKVINFVGGEAQIFVGDSDWEDYAVDLDAGTFNHDWLMGNDNSVAIYVRLQDRSNNMWFQLAANFAACGIKRDGEDTVLHSVQEEIGLGDRHLRVEARGNKYEFLVNGKRVCLVEDDSFSAGQVGLWARQGEDDNEVWIDNFSVTQLP